MQPSQTIQLHDIKPIVDIDDYSFYYLLGSSALILLLLAGLIYLFVKWYKTKNRYNKRKDYLKKLKKINLKDAKKSAYDITFYGRVFRDDSPRHTEMFKNLTQRLEDYKYKKDVDKLDKETLGYIELYKEMIDVW